MTQTRRRFLISPLDRPVLDDISKQTFSQTLLHSQAVTKIWKASTAIIQHLWSDSEKCLLSWIVSQVQIRSVRRKPSQYLHCNIAKCLHSPTNPASHLPSTFSVVISRRSQGWMRTDRRRHKQALLTLQLHFWSLFINCCFNHKLFHWACMKNFVFIHWPSLYTAGLWTVIFVPFGLETRFIKVLHYQPIARGFPSQGNPARPISLICILAKVMVGFAPTRLVSQLSDKLHPRQYAREGHSTSDTLIYLLQEIHEATDREHCGARIFFAHYSRLITVYS